MPEPLSTREALSAAWEEAEKKEDEQEESTGEGEETGGQSEDSEESLRSEGEEEEGGEEKEETSDEVDKEESSAAKTDKSESGKDDGDKEDKSKVESADEGLTKPPVSWKPSAREQWKSLPADIKKEIQRRETEIQSGLQQAAGHKKLAQEYYNVVRPFESLIRAQNSTPAQAIHNLMSTAARLTMGSAIEKAKVVGEIIKNYGVDIRVLDEHLSGQQPSKEEAGIEAILSQKLKPFEEFMSTMQANRQETMEQTNQRIASEIEEFKKNEFYEDVREDMADLMEMAANRGQNMTLKDAYDRACAMNPEISKILRQREEAAAAKQRQKEIDDKRRASASLESGGAQGEQTRKEREPHDRRGAIADAWDSLERGQRI